MGRVIQRPGVAPADEAREFTDGQQAFVLDIERYARAVHGDLKWGVSASRRCWTIKNTPTPICTHDHFESHVLPTLEAIGKRHGYGSPDTGYAVAGSREASWWFWNLDGTAVS